MKRKTAKEMLAESFRELAEKKTVDKITVQDIIENCGYSKTTVYRSFKDKYDLMAWDYIRSHEQKEYLKNLLLHTGGLDSFSRYMKQVHFESLSKCVLRASGMEELDIKTRMYVKSDEEWEEAKKVNARLIELGETPVVAIQEYPVITDIKEMLEYDCKDSENMDRRL